MVDLITQTQPGHMAESGRELGTTVTLGDNGRPLQSPVAVTSNTRRSWN